VNSVGGFLFDSIKPMILQEVEGKVRGELNRQARSVPQQFPNSINPVDMFLASARFVFRNFQIVLLFYIIWRYIVQYDLID